MSYFVESCVPFPRYSSSRIFNYSMIYQICDVVISISTWGRVNFWICLLNHTSSSQQTWPIDRYKQGQYFPVLTCTVHLTVCSYHVTYAFQSESTLYSCLNAKEVLARNSCHIGSLSDCKGTRTHNHLLRKRTLNHLAKLAKWLSCVVSTYLFHAFDWIFLSCHVHLSEWMHSIGT